MANPKYRVSYPGENSDHMYSATYTLAEINKLCDACRRRGQRDVLLIAGGLVAAGLFLARVLQ